MPVQAEAKIKGGNSTTATPPENNDPLGYGSTR
jgi:hypothetical protein